MKTVQESLGYPPTKRSPDHSSPLQKHSSSSRKNPYIGLTLKQYFQLEQSKAILPQIDEESCSSVEGGTPSFGGLAHKNPHRENAGMKKRNLITEVDSALEGLTEITHSQALHRLGTINFQQIVSFDKNSIKLPAIRQQRRSNHSRQQLMKQEKIIDKKEGGMKGDNIKLGIATTFLKNGQNIKGTQVIRNPFAANKKTMRARVTSTSFYQVLKDKDRERIKTQEEIPEHGGYDKSFIITKCTNKYGKRKDQGVNILKKFQNSLKLAN